MKRQEKKELGLLPRQVIKCVRHLKEDGELDKDMTREDMIFVFLAHVSDESEYSSAWDKVRAGEYGADWDAIFDFISKLIELIMKLFV